MELNYRGKRVMDYTEIDTQGDIYLNWYVEPSRFDFYPTHLNCLPVQCQNDNISGEVTCCVCI